MAIGTKVIKKKKRTLSEQTYVVPIAKGLGLTIKRFLTNTGDKRRDCDDSSIRKRSANTRSVFVVYIA